MTKPKPGTTNQGKPMARTCGSSEWHLVSRPPFKCTFHTERKNGNIKYIHYLKKILSVYLDKYVSHARLVSVRIKYVHAFFFLHSKQHSPFPCPLRKHAALPFDTQRTSFNWHHKGPRKSPNPKTRKDIDTKKMKRCESEGHKNDGCLRKMSLVAQSMSVFRCVRMCWPTSSTNELPSAGATLCSTSK